MKLFSKLVISGIFAGQVFLSALVLPAIVSSALASPALAGSFSLYLTRHAEKQSNNADPLLTKCGQHRAMLLADILRNVEIEAIYSTSYQRTLATAQPTARAKNISVTQYASNGLEQLARVLKQKQLNTLVVGHSNTTPMLLSLLTGESFDKISEDNFRHLYQVIITTDQNNEITHMVVTDLTQSLKCS